MILTIPIVQIPISGNDYRVLFHDPPDVVLDDPDSLADLPDDVLASLCDYECGGIGTEAPSGEPWEDDDLPIRMPKLWTRFGGSPLH